MRKTNYPKKFGNFKIHLQIEINNRSQQLK